MPSWLITGFIVWQFLFDCVVVWYAGRIVYTQNVNFKEMERRTLRLFQLTRKE